MNACFFFFSSRRRHTRCSRDWSSDVCSSDLPSPQRGESRLMVLSRTQGTIEHRNFGDIPDYLRSGDLLVMNNTRVLPARLIGNKETGGKVEILLVPSWNGANPVRNSSGALNPALRGGGPYGAEPGIILKSNLAE